MHLHTECIISETDSPQCHSCRTLLKFYWHKTGLSNRKIRSSNSFYRSWAALLCYPSTQSIKYVWIRQFLLSHCVENILLTPASIKICFLDKCETWGQNTGGHMRKILYIIDFVGERKSALLLLSKIMAKSNSSKIIRKLW